MKHKRKWLAICVSGSLVALVAWIWHEAEGEISAGATGGAAPTHGTTGQARAPAGIGARRIDPANEFAAEAVMPGQDAVFLASLAEGASDIKDLIRGGEKDLTRTLVEMNDPMFMLEKRKDCQDAFSEDLASQFKFDFTMVVERTREGFGQIVYTHGVPTMTDPFTPEEDFVPTDAQQQYVGCHVKALLGAEVPIPAGETRHVPLLFDWTGHPADMSKWTGQQLDQMIPQFEQAIAMMKEEGPPSDYPLWEYKLAMNQRILAYLRYLKEHQ